MQMTKTQYKAIAEPFRTKTNWAQYLYCTQGFETVNGKMLHSDRGHEFYDYFKNLDNIVFEIANNLADINKSKFDRDKFLEACGMQSDGRRYWSFVPTWETIKKVRNL